jgi:CHAD domain-containing protein
VARAAVGNGRRGSSGTTIPAIMRVTHVNDLGADPPDEGAVRERAFAISQTAGAGTPEENWLRAEQELHVAHGYDTVDRDLERVGMTIARLPAEAGVVWRLSLPRGERVEAWEPGNDGLAPPAEIAGILATVTAGKKLVPAPLVGGDPGAARLREMLEAQREALVIHDPGVRLGRDPENLHEHRVAARRTRAFLRAARAYLDPGWQRSVARPLAALGEATGPLRDLDVLVEHVEAERSTLAGPDAAGVDALLAKLAVERERARESVVAELDGEEYRALLARLRQPPQLASGVKAVPLKRIARREFRRLVESVDSLGTNPDEAAIHGLRIALKRARYAAELAAPSGAAGARFLADAKVLQDLLGEHQDAYAAEQQLRAATVVDAPTAAAFVAGRIADRQSARRERVRRRIPSAWKRLRKSGARFH